MLKDFWLIRLHLINDLDIDVKYGWHQDVVIQIKYIVSSIWIIEEIAKNYTEF